MKKAGGTNNLLAFIFGGINMIEKISHIKTKNGEYPLAFNLNVMEEFQEQYGSMKKWAEVSTSSEDGEPKVKDLKAGIVAMINEGIDIENEEKGENKPFVTSRQVGRIITEVGCPYMLERIQEIIVSSSQTGTEESKNE